MARIVEVRRAESLTEVTQARHNKFDLGIACKTYRQWKESGFRFSWEPVLTTKEVVRVPRSSDEQTFLYISTFWPFERKSLFVAVSEITSVFLEGQVVLGPTGHFGPNNWPVGSDVPFGPLPFVPCLAISLFGMEVTSAGEKVRLFWKFILTV